MIGLSVEQLTVIYTMARMGKALTAVQDVSFDVAPGEFVALIGPSGCGKTTVLNAVAGLQPVSGGRICVGGVTVSGPGRDRAMVFQAPALLPWRTVARNVAYGLELQGVKRAAARATAQRYIELVRLHGFEESYPHELSGGMQQRANLARALAVEPQVLLFDEPLAALDAQTREYMQAELQRIWLERPMTALYVTHHIAEAIFLADRVLVLAASPGRIKADLSVDLPRPRSLSIQRTPAFLALAERIWSLLEQPAWLSTSGDAAT